MIIDISIWILVLLAGIFGWRAGMFAAGKTLFICFVSSYFAIYFAPQVQTLSAVYLPEKYRVFTCAAVLLILLTVFILLLTVIWHKLRQNHIWLENSGVMDSFQKLDKLFGALFGGAAGYIIVGIVLLTASLLPVSNREYFARKAETVVIANAIYKYTPAVEKTAAGGKSKKSPEKVKTESEAVKFAKFAAGEANDDTPPPEAVTPVLVKSIPAEEGK